MEEFQTARTTAATQAASGMDVLRSNLKQLIDMWKKLQTLVEDLLDRLKAMNLVMVSTQSFSVVFALTPTSEHSLSHSHKD
jgi:hypothetical protein